MYFYLMWIFIPCVSLGVYSTWFSFLESHCDWGEGGERERVKSIKLLFVTSLFPRLLEICLYATTIFMIKMSSNTWHILNNPRLDHSEKCLQRQGSLEPQKTLLQLNKFCYAVSALVLCLNMWELYRITEGSSSYLQLFL